MDSWIAIEDQRYPVKEASACLDAFGLSIDIAAEGIGIWLSCLKVRLGTTRENLTSSSLEVDCEGLGESGLSIGDQRHMIEEAVLGAASNELQLRIKGSLVVSYPAPPPAFQHLPIDEQARYLREWFEHAPRTLRHVSFDVTAEWEVGD